MPNGSTGQDPFDAFIAQRDRGTVSSQHSADESVDPLDAFISKRSAKEDADKTAKAAKAQKEAVESTAGKLTLPKVESTLTDKALGALATEPVKPLPPKSDEERAALAKQAASIDPFEAATRARVGAPIQGEPAVGQQFAEDVTSGSKKMPIPAFTPAEGGIVPGIRKSSVGELTDLTNEYLNRPDIPKTRKQAFFAGATADTVNLVNDMFLSPLGLTASALGATEVVALSRAGKLGVEAARIAQDYEAMRAAGASATELAGVQNKMRQAIEATAKAQKAVTATKVAAQTGARAFSAQGAQQVVEGAKEGDIKKVLSGTAQIIIGEAGARGAAGGAERGVQAETAARVAEAIPAEPTAVRTPQVPETPTPPPEPTALLEAEVSKAKADVAADNLETAAAELRKAAKVEKTKEPSKAKEPAKAAPAPKEELGVASGRAIPQEESAKASVTAEPTSVGGEGAPPAENIRLLSPEEAAKLSDKDFQRWTYPRSHSEARPGPEADGVLEVVRAKLLRGDTFGAENALKRLTYLDTEGENGAENAKANAELAPKWKAAEAEVAAAKAKEVAENVPQRTIPQETLQTKPVTEEKPVPEKSSTEAVKKGARRVPFAKAKAVEAPATTAKEPEKVSPSKGIVAAPEPEFKAESLKSGQSTLEAYKDNPARAAMRDKIENAQIEKVAPVPEGQQPTAVVLGGGTASGKTTAAQAAFEKSDQYVSVDADKLKLDIPEYQGLKTIDPARAAARVHDESKLMAHNTVRKAMEQRKNILYDGSTSGEDKPAFIKELKDAGYKVKLNFVDIPTEEAIRRANNRARTSQNPINKGRFVPEEVIREKHQNAAKSFFKLKDLADEVRLYDNSGPAPELVYERIGKEPEKVYNQEKYDAFQRKAEGTQEAAAERAGTRAVQEGLPKEERVSAGEPRPSVVEGAPQSTAAVKRKVPFYVKPAKPEGTAGPVPTVAEPPKPSKEVLAGKPAESVQPTPGGGAGETGAVSGGADRTGGGAGVERVGGERVSVPKSLSGAGGQQPVRRARANSQLKPSSNSVGNDYHITASDNLGEGGIGAKFDDNVAAIETLKKIEKDGRKATPEEQKILVKYVGWGGMPQAFDPYKRDWNTKYNKLKELLTEEEYDAARGSTQFAHFTSEDVVRFIYDGLAKMGYDGGRMLEPAAGTGNFLGVMPVEMGANSKRVAVEIDPISGRIAQQLYQNADVRISPFEKVRFPQNFFDLVATNVPFSDVKPFDKNYDKLKLNLHNYFMVRSLDLLRPGGIQAVITSRYTMDSIDKRARGLLADRSDLIAAFRLPSTAFKENANTEVVTDMLFLKKRATDQEAAGEPFAEATPVNIKEDGTIEDNKGPSRYNVNEYFLKHPENVLGKFTKEGTMYGAAELSVALPAANLPAKLKEAIDKVPESAYEKYVPPDKAADNFEQMIAEKREVKPFGHIIQDKKVWQNDMVGEETLPSGAKQAIFKLVERKDLSPKQVKMVSNAMVLRDHARNILTSEYQDKANVEIAAHRRKLNEGYDKFVKRHGPINSAGVARILHDDPDYPLLQALEKYEPRTKEAAKSDIFFKRTVSGKTTPTLTTAKDGMLYSLSESGKLDWNLMADKLKKSVNEIQEELQEQGLVFKNPEGDWETSDDYLSGNVREKLASAEAAAALDKQYQKNVDALKPIVPRDLTPGEIAVRLGATWIPPKHIEQFAIETLGFRRDAVSVTYSPSPSKWIVKVDYGKDSALNRDTWGTKDFYGSDLLEAALNMQSPKAYDRVGEGSETKSVVNPDRTLAAQEKQANLLKKFSEWVWEDPDRADQLGRLYNDNYNSTVPWKGDGQHLSLPTLAVGKTLHPWVKDGIWRVMRQPTAYIAYEVGLGKTLVYLGGALEAKRVGKFRKPMIVAHNATIQGYATDAKAFFPTSNILVVTKKDLEAGNRQRFMARIATGDWDAVIVPHSSFGLLPARPETYERHMMGEIRAAREWLTLNKDEMDRKAVKQIEKAMDRIEAKIKRKIEKLKEKQDVTVFFEDLGVDALLVDEADCLPYGTKVKTDEGEIPIGEIVEKRLNVKVLSVNVATGELEWKAVTGWFWNAVTDPLYRITHQHGTITCTARHKIWTRRGYIQADQLSSSDILAFTSPYRKGLPVVQTNLHVSFIRRAKQREAKALLKSLRVMLADVSTGKKAKASRLSLVDGSEAFSERNSQPKEFGAHEEVLQQSREFGKHAEEDAGEDILGARWKRTAYQTPNHPSQETQLADGVRNRNSGSGGQVPKPASLLQSGSGLTRASVSDRSGWENPSPETVEVLGPAQDRRITGSRVVDIEVHERTGDTLAGLRGSRSDRVYCLEVEGNHNFFADGVLVSNSFKNLMFQTQMTRVAGLGSPEGSDRALDLLMKSRLMMERNNGAGVYFASGTPLSNSIAEVYSIQKYLQPRELEKLGISQFDAWAANFGNVIQQLESSPEDPTKFRVTSSFSEFNNLPDLARMWRGISDYRTGDMVGIKRPKVNVDYRALDASPEQLNYISDQLVPRSEAIRKREVEPDEDNMLNVTTDGRKSALDMRLVDPNADDFPSGKINQLADDIVKEWKGSEERKGVQLVALDFSTPADRTPGKFMAYRDLTDKLIRRGIPDADIGWIHDADTEAKLATFIEKVNTGQLRVILGSTNKMGVGMNLQKKAIGIHHVDVGWRPRDLEQRRGRVERYGNENDEVFERFWTTKKTFDAYMLQKNETKAKFIHRFLKGELTQRRGVEDISGRALTFGELKGITTGRPEVMEKNKVDIELDKLQRLSAQHEIEQTNMRVKLGRDRSSIDTLKDGLVEAAADEKTAQQKPTEFTAKIGKTRFDERKEAGAALIDALAKADGFRTQKIEKVGEYSDFDIMVSGGPEVAGKPFLRGKLDYSITRSEDPVGIMRSMENRVDSIPAFRQGIEQRLAKTQTDIAELEKQIGKPFSKQEEMNDLVKRSMELAKILGMKEDDAQAAMAKEEKPPEPEKVDIEEIGADNTIFTQERKEAAEKRFRGKLLEARAGIDPTMLKDLAEIGGFYLEAGIRDFADWSKKIIEHFRGSITEEKLKPHLKTVYDKAIDKGDKQRPGFAANIRLSNVKAAEDVINVIKDTAKKHRGRIEEQRRGTMPFTKTESMAERLVREGQIRPKDLEHMKKGTALNAEELKAARSILVALSEDVAKSLKAFKADDSQTNLLRVVEAVKKQRAVQAAVSGAIAEAGRALNSMKIAAEAIRAKTAKEKALDALGGEITEEMVRLLADIPEGDYAAINKFIRDHTQFSAVDKLRAYWIANVLSGWWTHARNFTSNAAWAVTLGGIRPLRGLLDIPLSKVMKTERKYYAMETLPAFVGYMEGIPTGIRKAWEIMKNGRLAGELSKVEQPRYYEFPGGAKNPWNLVGRAMDAGDVTFSTMAYESELAAIAYRESLKGGRRGSKQRFQQIRANPTPEMIDEAKKFAGLSTFRQPPDAIARMAIKAREMQVPPDWAVIGGLRPLGFVIPFINTPWQITKGAFRFSPLGAAELLSKKARTEPGKASDIVAKALIGAAVIAAFAVIAANGNLTGPAPPDAGARDEFYRLGKKAYSVRVGNHWYPYLQWGGPIGISIAAVAAWYNKYESDRKVPTTERIANAAAATARAITDQSFFQGIANLLDALREGKQLSTQFISSMVSGFVPFSSLLRNITQQKDPYIRDARGVYEQVARGIPFASETLPTRPDVLGRPAMQGQIGKANQDAVDTELARLGIQPSPLLDRLQISKIEFDLSPKGTEYYKATTGRALYNSLSARIQDPAYKAMDDYSKAKEIDRIVGLTRSAGRLVMLAKLKSNPEFGAQPLFKLRVPFARRTEAAPPGRP